MMKYSVTSLLAGLIFGLGLMVSGMANPEKVLGFLDIAGLWDPSLAFVMGGAIIVGLVAFAAARRRTLSFLGFTMKMPANNRIEPRLVIGSMMFGIGWGIAGFCPRSDSRPWGWPMGSYTISCVIGCRICITPRSRPNARGCGIVTNRN